MLVYMIMFITKVQEGLRYSDLPDASLVTRTFKTWSYFSLGFSLGLVAVFMIVVPLLITSTHFSLSGKGNNDSNFVKYLYLKLEEYACIMESQIFLRWTFSEFKSFSNPNHAAHYLFNLFTPKIIVYPDLDYWQPRICSFDHLT